MSVQYKYIPGFPGYRVGDDGTVWTAWFRIRGGEKGEHVIGSRWRALKQLPRDPRKPYLYVTLSQDGKAKQLRVNRLVLLAFVGPCPDGMEGCHKSGNAADNRPDNLYWGTHRQNIEDKKRHGMTCGEHHPHKLTDELVRQIRQRAEIGETQESIAKSVGVKQAAISNVVLRKTWQHVT